ncbi:helix-turn-helix domain-containing protein [Solihabitans fulvus]|uniref:Helix-turn-helix domain-containing protein n=1 Tax=Solihabitans fulvus TaxID=1892852 RepID=A0A5B2XP93_9PSEU|nr:helix-turn-helix transcriptional regulator [Solihabitans fulvus]KAA2264672.1 helix-turn-helix domain-containing protein [Solihabitans fulvus]
MGVDGSPVLQRRRLGHELRRLRDAAEKKLDEVAEHLECSEAKISRIETGKVPVLARDVRDMLELYGIDGEKRDSLLGLAKDAKREGYWERFAEAAPRRFSTFFGLEAAAVEMLNYEPLIICGLLQTPGYARSMMLANINVDPDQVEKRVQLRMERQKRLTDPDNPLRLHAIIDEAALNRQVGGRQVMQEQFEHLVRMAELPNVTIQFIDVDEGAYPGMGAPFVLLGFADPGDPDVVHLEQNSTALFLEAPADAERYRLLFDRMRKAAMGPNDTAEIVRGMIDRRF